MCEKFQLPHRGCRWVPRTVVLFPDPLSDFESEVKKCDHEVVHKGSGVNKHEKSESRLENNPFNYNSEIFFDEARNPEHMPYTCITSNDLEQHMKLTTHIKMLVHDFIKDLLPNCSSLELYQALITINANGDYAHAAFTAYRKRSESSLGTLCENHWPKGTTI
ncbi:hypothetical protein BC827DRAFT_1157800 [Russula dissimulans]|nr:hypothetical protein BC827DRAFT_1157800 [Russula dissimulans]